MTTTKATKAMDPATTWPMVRAHQVHKRFGHVEVLKGIDLEVHSGEVVVLLGPSGSGKSTFLRCVNNLERIDSGSVHVQGELIGFRRTGSRVHHLRPREATRQRRDIGMVFQHFNLFPHQTVLGNVMEAPVGVLGMPKAEARETALRLLEQVGLAEKADAYPRQLSGGQQQRVALARALITRPQVLFGDEPTGALDSATSRDVLRLLRELVDAERQTVVMVTHDPVAASYADRVVFLVDGRVSGELQRPTAEQVSARMTRLETVPC